ncbi:type 2 isopentenyl-diphosphate Delta-isomerase [Lacticaseibacillus daqingensis]|uniref:type 2 isopentenyl-diphosphate Delta-isomerase n=1 Tax=Lacticaseibacillus daqingensis TaxID=2486014 RepID=UPI000F77BC5B|nr:type 2 isopentenyl-diphosphate Delta-isomerase [Lacticaseibacillus daqingensis]
MRPSIQSHRKDEHVFLAEKYFKATASAGFADVRLLHDPLPEAAVAAVRFDALPFGWRWPLYINAMTGGSAQTATLNGQLARIAAACDLAIASGSQAVALAEPALAPTFATLRNNAPHAFILGNLGATKTPAQVAQAVAMLDADAIELHLNAVQELVMPEGDRNFHWLDAIAAIVATVTVPVVVKEVGNGFTREALAKLRRVGVTTVDIGGRGGTDFGQIENARRPRHDASYLQDFGQTTVESLLEAQGSGLTILATGGLRTPLDALKALRLGASAVGLSGLVLHWLLQDGEAETIAHLKVWQTQLTGLMALVGATTLPELTTVPVVLAPTLDHYRTQRGLPHP